LFKVMTATNFVHVPYRGNAAAYTDLIGGQIQLIFADVASGRPHVQSGALRALGVTAPDAACHAARHSGDRRIRPRLRGERLVRLRGPKGTPARDRREAQRGDQCGPQRSGGEGALRRARGDAAGVHAEAIRRISRLGIRALGQGREGRGRAGD
jgi:hypothetical protein